MQNRYKLWSIIGAAAAAGVIGLGVLTNGFAESKSTVKITAAGAAMAGAATTGIATTGIATNTTAAANATTTPNAITDLLGKHYLVVFKTPHAVPADIVQSVSAAGGMIISKMDKIGTIVVVAKDPNFLTKMKAVAGVYGVAEDQLIKQPASSESEVLSKFPNAFQLPNAQQKLPTARAIGGVAGSAGAADSAGAGAAAGAGLGKPTFDLGSYGPEQWNLMRIHADAASTITSGSHKTVVAVLDTGVAWNISALTANMLCTNDEVKHCDPVQGGVGFDDPTCRCPQKEKWNCDANGQNCQENYFRAYAAYDRLWGQQYGITGLTVGYPVNLGFVDQNNDNILCDPYANPPDANCNVHRIAACNPYEQAKCNYVTPCTNNPVTDHINIYGETLVNSDDFKCDAYPFADNEYNQGNSHGTAMAGVIAGKGSVQGIGQNLGLAGYKWGVNQYNVAYNTWKLSAVYDAIAKGYKVINMSFGLVCSKSAADCKVNPGSLQCLTATVWANMQDLASQNGIVLVNAPDNGSIDVDSSTVTCPTDGLPGPCVDLPCAIPGVICVSNSAIRPGPFYPQENFYDVLAFTSNYGNEITISAPRGDYGPNFPPASGNLGYPDFAYGMLSTEVNLNPTCVANRNCSSYMGGGPGGTSSATAEVSAVVGLMLDIDPTLTPTQVRAILTSTAQKPTGPDGQPRNEPRKFGAGIVDAYAAVKKVWDNKYPQQTAILPKASLARCDATCRNNIQSMLDNFRVNPITQNYGDNGSAAQGINNVLPNGLTAIPAAQLTVKEYDGTMYAANKEISFVSGTEQRADLNPNSAAITNDSLFGISSMSKPFTAALVYKLEQDGKLGAAGTATPLYKIFGSCDASIKDCSKSDNWLPKNDTGVVQQTSNIIDRDYFYTMKSTSQAQPGLPIPYKYCVYPNYKILSPDAASGKCIDGSDPTSGKCPYYKTVPAQDMFEETDVFPCATKYLDGVGVGKDLSERVYISDGFWYYLQHGHPLGYTSVDPGFVERPVTVDDLLNMTAGLLDSSNVWNSSGYQTPSAGYRGPYTRNFTDNSFNTATGGGAYGWYFSDKKTPQFDGAIDYSQSWSLDDILTPIVSDCYAGISASKPDPINGNYYSFSNSAYFWYCPGLLYQFPRFSKYAFWDYGGYGSHWGPNSTSAAGFFGGYNPNWPNVKPYSPGAYYNYSNTNYILLGMVIEKITGKTFKSNLDNLIANLKKPLDGRQLLTHTVYEPTKAYQDITTAAGFKAVHGYCGTDTSVGSFLDVVVPNFAKAIRDANGDVSNVITSYEFGVGPGAGGLLSNTCDLTHWIQALFAGQVLNKTEFAKMMKLTWVNPMACAYRLGCLKSDQPTKDFYESEALSFGGKVVYDADLGPIWLWNGGGDAGSYVNNMIYLQNIGLIISVAQSVSGGSPSGLLLDVLSAVYPSLKTRAGAAERLSHTLQSLLGDVGAGPRACPAGGCGGVGGGSVTIKPPISLTPGGLKPIGASPAPITPKNSGIMLDVAKPAESSVSEKIR